MTDQHEIQKIADSPGWSWIIASIGLVLVVGSAGFMLYRAFAVPPSPPVLVVEVDEITPSGNGYLVRILVTNTGGSSAAGLVVEGELKYGDTAVETRSVTLDYVPLGSQRRAGLFFNKDPRTHTLQVQAKAYQQP